MQKNIVITLGDFALEIIPGQAMSVNRPIGISDSYMYNVALLAELDSMTPESNQFRLDVAAFEEAVRNPKPLIRSSSEFQALINHLLLMALPTPSPHLH